MSSYKRRPSPGNTEWLVHDRFGMFIHFGLYAMPARHEWIRYDEVIQDAEYQPYFDHFNPDLFDAREWAKKAKNAGMKYAVLTTKHHEGFCLFDSKYTEYKITNTPFGRDLVKEYVEAFRAEGLKIGFYYSLLDWNHPHYTIDDLHPMAAYEDAEERNKSRDMNIYRQYMCDQVTELMSNYGKIDILWFDFSFDPVPSHPRYQPWMKGKRAPEWGSENLIAIARKLQPGIIINNRTDIEQDTWTPEQIQREQWPTHPETGELLTWEVCQTFSGSWGYYRDEHTWKSPEQLITMLIKTVASGGNLLMNVGPTARGNFDYRADAALEEFGKWMKLNSRSIYGCTKAEPEFETPLGCRLTQSEDGKRLYIHILDYPLQMLTMPSLAGKVAYSQFLHDASELPFYDSAANRCGEVMNDTFVLPALKPNVLVPVIEVFLK